MRVLIIWIGQVVGQAGGTERVMINLANAMQERGHMVTLVYCTEKNGHFFYPVNKNIKCVNLINFISGRKFESIKMPIRLKLEREIKRIINKKWARNLNGKFRTQCLKDAVNRLVKQECPDIIVSAWISTTETLIESGVSLQFPIISMIQFNAETVINAISYTQEKALINSDAVQVLMPNDQLIFNGMIPRVHSVCIPNVVSQYDYPKKINHFPIIINIARLDGSQKRQHLLLEAFAKISEQFPQWKVELWGEEQSGETYTRKLQEIIQKHHLENQVKLCGNTDDVLSVYQRASIFAFPSAYEGFGLSMTEAMSAGLPVVAYRSCPAVNELVRDGETGLLVDDGVDALAEGLKKLMEDQELRERMGRAAHESMKEFAPGKIWDQWEALMQDVIAKHKAKMEH